MEITIGILCFLLVFAVVGIIYYRNACEMLRCTIEQQGYKIEHYRESSQFNHKRYLIMSQKCRELKGL